MTIEDLMIIALAVSLDAFGVAVAIGINDKATIVNKLCFALSFGFFQFLCSFIGGVGGKLFTENVASVPCMLGGIVIAIVGILMIKEGMEEKDDNVILTFKMYFVLGISVSIDAIVVGFIAFSSIGSIATLGLTTAIVGIVTMAMSLIAFILAKFLGKINVVGKYGDYIGGIILILFGLKMIFF